MTVQLVKGTYVFSCDGCSEENETYESVFSHALEKAKEDGFLPKREDGKWFHYCGDCYEHD